MSGDDEETLEHLLSRLGVKDWDFVLIGDGSGSNWQKEAGWASVSIEKLTGERLVHAGAVNRGTVNFAEMMAYLQPLEWLASRETERRKQKGPTRAYHVHVVTDSEYCRSTGSGPGRMMAKNAGLWAVFDVFTRHGFVLHWHWLPRENCDLNRYCDKLSKMARKLVKGYNLQEKMMETGADTRTVYEVNPSDPG